MTCEQIQEQIEQLAARRQEALDEAAQLGKEIERLRADMIRRKSVAEFFAEQVCRTIQEAPDGL